MNSIIKDGKGKGFSAAVTEEQRLSTDTTSRSRGSFISAVKQESYIISSNYVTTATSEGGVLYIKNTDSRNFHVTNIRVCARLATPAAGHDAKWRAYLDVTDGTLVTDASAALVTNTNTSASKTFQGDVYKGVTSAETVTGSLFETIIDHLPGHSVDLWDGMLILGKDKTLALSVEPSAAGEACARVIGYYEDLEA